MYQSPVNALAELIANAWDADSPSVAITLPSDLQPSAKILVNDTGVGMTFEECQNHYLNVGRNRRTVPDDKTAAGRTTLGRKGIGKFAGFGIARQIKVETVSAETGESTVFTLDLDELMKGEYVNAEAKPIKVQLYEGPDPARKKSPGTTISLSNLTFKQLRSADAFAQSMARRFLMLKQQASFEILINGKPLPDALEAAGVEFNFPKDYTADERGDETIIDDDWGVDDFELGRLVRWRILFLKKPIEEEELRGVAVYAGIKLAQRPFFFNITQGVTGQAGMEYLVGQVNADFIDQLPQDLIATERQRINWEHEDSKHLLAWGQKKVREALKVWIDRRGAERERQLSEKLDGYGWRLSRLQKHEREIVKRALRQLGKIPTLSDEQFEETANAILTAWEGGRLRDLITTMGEATDMTESKLLEILLEVDVLSALNMAEAVLAKLQVISGLKERIEGKDLENPLRDYIAEHPWLIAPQWETFRAETGLKRLCEEAAAKSKWSEMAYAGRVDLTLAAGNQLLLLEFMKPGKALDDDHLNRFDRYVRTLSSSLKANSALGYTHVTAYLVADRLDEDPVLAQKIEEMRVRDMFAMDWTTLLSRSLDRWRDLLSALTNRSPGDPRVVDLKADLERVAGIKPVK
jgi:hypothetical protein